MSNIEDNQGALNELENILSSECKTDIYVVHTDSEQQTNQIVSPSSIPSLTDVTVNNQLKIFAKIDNFAASVYEELSVVDNCFGSIADNFKKMANESLNNYGSVEVSAAFEVAAFAMKGIGNIANAIEMAQQKAKIMPVLQKEAATKGALVQTLLNQVKALLDSDRILFDDCFKGGYPKDSNVLKLSGEYKVLRSKVLDILSIYRASLYHYRLLQYLDRQFQAWNNGEVGNEIMVDYGDVNREIVYNILYQMPYDGDDYARLTRLVFADMLNVVGIDFEEECMDNISSRILPIIMDEQLMAAVLSNEEMNDEQGLYFYNLMQAKNDNCSSCLKSDIYQNKSIIQHLEMGKEYYGYLRERNYRLYSIAANIFLMPVLAGIVSYAYWDSIWWGIVGGVLFFFLMRELFGGKIDNVREVYNDKLSLMFLYMNNTMGKMAGDQPKINTLRVWSESINKTIIYGVVGFILGLLFLPFPGGGLVGAFVACGFAKSRSSEQSTDGSDYKQINTGSGWLAYVINVALIIGIISCFID